MDWHKRRRIMNYEVAIINPRTSEERKIIAELSIDQVEAAGESLLSIVHPEHRAPRYPERLHGRGQWRESGNAAMTVKTMIAKKPKGKRREVAPLEPIDPQDGEKMKALSTDRHRAFVRAMYQVKPGHGAAVRAAKLAGFGTPQSSPQSMATIASRLTHDPRVQEAFAEQDQLYVRASAPRTIHALSALIENPASKDHARGIAMVLDHMHPTETVVKVDHKHDVTPSAKETAELLQRIAELSEKFSVRLPAPLVIDHDAA